MLRIAERFWSKVDKTAGCWIWKGWKYHTGYGGFQVSPEVHIAANRLVYILTVGPIPARMLVCHHCDNPPCVNPAHLFLGSGKDNMDDMVSKGRWRGPTGENHPFAKLSNEDVEAIRSRYTGFRGEQQILASEFGVSQSTISSIVLGKKRKGARNAS